MMKLVYYNSDEVSEERYLNFLEKYYKERIDIKKKRLTWYQNSNYKHSILLAMEGDEIVGQSCAIRNSVIVKNSVQNIWWSVDTFVLSEWRGRGIGKILQQKLHKDFENFSSLKFSKTNGFIKLKYGAKKIFINEINYYPINNILPILLDKITLKIFKRKINLYFKDKYNFFYILNSFSYNTKCDIYFDEFQKYSDDVIAFINSQLNKNDFYVERNKEYIQWKYYSNPSISTHCIIIRAKEKIVGVCFYTDIFKKDFYNTELFCSKVLDLFYSKEIDSKFIFISLVNYFLDKNQKIDGIISINKFNYFPSIIIYKDYFLSTIGFNEIKTPYISLGDQDMEQML